MKVAIPVDGRLHRYGAQQFAKTGALLCVSGGAASTIFLMYSRWSSVATARPPYSPDVARYR